MCLPVCGRDLDFIGYYFLLFSSDSSLKSVHQLNTVLIITMQRPVFERSIVDGFKSPKTESVAMTSTGKRMFAGTSDGTLVLYECRPDSSGSMLIIDFFKIAYLFYVFQVGVMLVQFLT